MGKRSDNLDKILQEQTGDLSMALAQALAENLENGQSTTRKEYLIVRKRPWCISITPTISESHFDGAISGSLIIVDLKTKQVFDDGEWKSIKKTKANRSGKTEDKRSRRRDRKSEGKKRLKGANSKARRGSRSKRGNSDEA